jgi:multidrug efflux pump subunit AcrB
LDALIERLYHPLLTLVTRHAGLTVAVFVALLGVAVAYVGSGRIDFSFRPSVETDVILAGIEMPSGTPVARTREVAFQIEAAARRTLELNGETDILVGVFTTVSDRSSNNAEVTVVLVPPSGRRVTGEQFANLWRDQIGGIPDLESLFFDYLIGPGGSSEIEIELSHPEIETLRQAAEEVAAAIDRYPGVEDVRKGFGREMPQFNFEIKPEGRSLGITARELGRQIRHSFYGAEALRQPRDRDELRVMVKLPDQDRRSMSGLQDLMVRGPDGGEIPLSQAATLIATSAPVRIERVNESGSMSTDCRPSGSFSSSVHPGPGKR